MSNFTIIDLVIVIFLIGAIGRGLYYGFFRLVFSTIGFFIGLIVAGWLVPPLVHTFLNTAWQSMIVIVIVMLAALWLSAVGDRLGAQIRMATDKEPLQIIETSLGVLFSFLSVLVVTWLLAAVIGRLPIPNLSDAINSSRIVRTINETFPPAPGIVARIIKYASPNGLPQVFVDLDPKLAPTVIPSDPAVQAAAQKAEASTVKVQGFGCGGIITGSGFVVGTNLIATNAHVVAGIRRPVVFDAKGAHTATPVYFDSNLDFAVLRVDKINAPVLAVADQITKNGTTTAILGYPGGGPLKVGAGVIISERPALGRNIYNTGLVNRQIYVLQANVQPGNSGGPVVTADGKVVAVIFAKSVNDNRFGYALPSTTIEKGLTQATASRSAVSTGTCAAE